MPLNLHHLAVFYAVARTGSITQAADDLCVSQPAVSKQLRLLERSLGATLVDRGVKGTILTEAGVMLADYARRIFALADEAEQTMGDLRGVRAGRVAIGASRTIGTYLLPEVFVRFRRQYPDVHATLEVASSASIARRVAEGDLHVGLVETPVEMPGLEAREFCRDDFVAIVCPSHPFARKLKSQPRVSVEAFCGEPFVVRETDSDSGSFVQRALQERGITLRPALALGSSEAIKRAVAAGMGVAIVSRLSIELELETRRLAVVPLARCSIRRPLYRLTPARRHRSPALAAFLEALSKHE